MFAASRGSLLGTVGTRSRSSLRDRLPTKLWPRAADDDCLDKSAEEWMGCDLDEGVHAVSRLYVPAFWKVKGRKRWVGDGT
jgi:hypothetical protein